MTCTIVGRRLLGPGGALEYPLLSVEDGRLTGVRGLVPDECERLPVTHRFPGATLVPAFLDIHLHGGAGYDVMEGTPGAIRAIGTHLARHGVGAYLPTTVTSPLDDTLRALSGLAREIERAGAGHTDAATPLGIHLEGPFLSHAKRGVHTAALLQKPSISLFNRFWEAAEGRIVLMTLAPEIPGALDLIAHASALGVRCSLGHSNATAAEAQAGHAAGAVSATHTFNAMRALDHREPGLAAYVLDRDSLYAEIIADGIHVDPMMVRLFLKAKGADRILLVTDGISATGMPDGRYRLGDMEVDVTDGRCTSGGAIAGSVLTLDRAVRNLVAFTGTALETAIRAASSNPARLIGQQNNWGSLEPGQAANFAVLSPAGEVIETFLHGIPAIHSA